MRQIFKKYILILLVLSMVVSSFATTASAYDYSYPAQDLSTGGSITLLNVHSGAQVYWMHIIRGNPYKETGYEFYPDFTNTKWKYTTSTLKCFVDAYGLDPADYIDVPSGYSSLDQFLNSVNNSYITNAANETVYDQMIALEQAVIGEVRKDYVAATGENPPVNGAANAGTANASYEFRMALANIKDLAALSTNHPILYNKLDVRTQNGELQYYTTLPARTDRMGVYILCPTSNEQNMYNPTAAFVSFGYDDETGLPNRVLDIIVKAKRITNNVNKTAGAGCASMSIGDTASYTITGLYPYFADQYKDTALYTIMDRSDFLQYDISSIVVKIGDKTLTKNTDYKIVEKYNNNRVNGFEIVLLDGNGTLTYNQWGNSLDYGDGSLPSFDMANAGKTVTVTYSAKVISLLDGKAENTATVRTNTGVDVNGDHVPDEPNWETQSKYISDSYEYKLVKTNDYASADDRKTLSGAEFKVKIGDKYVLFDKTDGSGENPDTYTVKGLTDNKDASGTTVIVDTRAGAILAGLDADMIYEIIETKAPAGYSLSTNSMLLSAAKLGLEVKTVTKQGKFDGIDTTTVTNTVVFKNDTTKEVSSAVLEASIDFKNTKLFDLPETGSIGTYVFTLVGVSVMASALLVFVSQRRRETEV